MQSFAPSLPAPSLRGPSLPAQPITARTRFAVTEAGRAALAALDAPLAESREALRWPSLSPLTFRRTARTPFAQWRRQETLLWDAAAAYLYRLMWAHGYGSPPYVQPNGYEVRALYMRDTWKRRTARERAERLACVLAGSMCSRLSNRHFVSDDHGRYHWRKGADPDSPLDDRRHFYNARRRLLALARACAERDVLGNTD